MEQGSQGYEIDPAPSNPAVAAKPVSLRQSEQADTVAATGFAVVFSKSTGTISALERGGGNVLGVGGGPCLHLWRVQRQLELPTDDNLNGRHRTVTMTVDRCDLGRIILII